MDDDPKVSAAGSGGQPQAMLPPPAPTATAPPQADQQARSLDGAASAAAPPAQDAIAVFCADNEVSPAAADDLRFLHTLDAIYLIFDDSRSMTAKVNPSKLSKYDVGFDTLPTRWAELKVDAAVFVELALAAAPRDGVFACFLNRGGGAIFRVTAPADLVPWFKDGPNGGTPMNTRLSQVYAAARQHRGDVLVVPITDGEPNPDDGGDRAFLSLCNTQARPRNVFISVVECTDSEEEMAYLDAMDAYAGAHNADDYEAERKKVLASATGPWGVAAPTRFTKGDYYVLCMLGALLYDYWKLDEPAAVTYRAPWGTRPPSTYATRGQSAMRRAIAGGWVAPAQLLTQTQTQTQAAPPQQQAPSVYYATVAGVPTAQSYPASQQQPYALPQPQVQRQAPAPPPGGCCAIM